MKKFLYRVLAVILLVVAVLGVSLFFIPNNKLPDNSLFASHDKHQRLEALQSPKVVLVGGSNWPFGVKSAMVEDEFHLVGS